MKTLIGSAAVALALVGLAGCSDAEPSKDEDAIEGMVDDMESAPACSEVWVDGQTLPADYEGCNEDDSFLVLTTSGECELATYEGDDAEFYAELGGTITKAEPTLAEDPEYAELFASC